ncbi:helix-turn-helix domain-containing protein [Streptomyces sp. NPDC050164]|uniref:helix-turn-helix domain-containing protein n=1 Tax=Streptomyces sp. NPDC050164 TaxID=3365605 RepID=UPI0037998E37
MCRPEKPITTRNKALRELAEWLRDQREHTRQGYRALSVRAGFHATTLQRAASGESVPKLQTVLGYARACDASPEEARRLWKRARYEETRQARGGRGLPSPRPEFIRDFVDMSAALQDLYEKAGSPTLRTMEQRAGGYGVLPRSTAHRIVTKQAMPHSLQQFQGYLRACEVAEVDWPDWEGAWTRAWRHEKRDDFAALGASPVSDRDILASSGWEAVTWDSPEKERATKVFRERFYQEYSVVTTAGGEVMVTHDGRPLRDGEVVMTRNGVALRPVKKGRGPAPRLRANVRGPASRHTPDRPTPGQLAFAIAEPRQEPAREPDALF